MAATTAAGPGRTRALPLALAAILVLLSAGTCRAQTCDPAVSRPCKGECLDLSKPCYPAAVTCNEPTQACNGQCIPAAQQCTPQGLCPSGRDFCALNFKCILASEDCVKVPDVDLPRVCPSGQIFCIYKNLECKPTAECDYNPFNAAGFTYPKAAAAVVAGAALSCALVAMAF